MFKKIAIASFVAAILLGGTFRYAEAQNVSLSQFIEILISIGVIPQDKIAAARAIAGGTAVAANTAQSTSTGMTSNQNITVVAQGAPTLTLSYSAGREAQLAATFNISVTAGNSAVSILTNSASAHLTGGPRGGQVSLNSARVQVGVAAGEKTDMYGRNYTILSPGQTLQFTVTITADPRQMFAGSYSAVLDGLFALDPQNPSGSLFLSIPAISTSSLTIVGETSPYISSATNTVPAGGTVFVIGQRLSKNGMTSVVFIDGVSIPKSSYNTSSTDNTLSFAVPSYVSSGNHTLTLKDGEGQVSNSSWFNVQGGTVTTQPSGSSPTLSMSGVPTLSLSYDSANKEATLTGSATLNVTAGAADVYVLNGGLTLREFTGVNAPHGLTPNQTNYSFTAVSNVQSATVRDVYGNLTSVLKVPAGQTGTFAARISMDPKLMYSGSYSVYVWGITVLDGGNYKTIDASLGDSSRVTILGEKGVAPTPVYPTTQACAGSQPSGAGIVMGNTYYTTGYGTNQWTFVTGTPNACQWSCASGYGLSGNGCALLGTAAPTYPVTQACGGAQPASNGYAQVGGGYYTTGYGTTQWTFVTGTPYACQYTCTNGGVYTGNGCAAPAPAPAPTPTPAPSAPASISAPSLSTSSWYADDPSTWPTVSTPSALNGNQAMRVKGFDGSQYYDKTFGVNSAKITASPAAGTSQLILYVYDYGVGNYVSDQKTVNVTITNKPVTTAPAPASISTSFSISAQTISLGQSITLTSTTNSPSGTLRNAAIDESTDNANWSSGAPCGYWSNVTNENSSHTISCSFMPTSAGTYYFRSRGSDNTGLSNFVFQTLTVNPSTSMAPAASNLGAGSIGLEEALRAIWALSR